MENVPLFEAIRKSYVVCGLSFGKTYVLSFAEVRKIFQALLL